MPGRPDALPRWDRRVSEPHAEVGALRAAAIRLDRSHETIRRTRFGIVGDVHEHGACVDEIETIAPGTCRCGRIVTEHLTLGASINVRRKSS